MPGLDEGEVIRHPAFQAEATEPPKGEVEFHLLSEAPLGADAIKVAHEQYSNHPLGTDRRTPYGAVVRSHVLAHEAQTEDRVDPAQEMALRHPLLETELAKQRRLLDLQAHHGSAGTRGRIPRSLNRGICDING